MSVYNNKAERKTNAKNLRQLRVYLDDIDTLMDEIEELEISIMEYKYPSNERFIERKKECEREVREYVKAYNDLLNQCSISV